MNYISTRNKNVSLSSADAIVKGISSEGGLFVPASFPKITLGDLSKMANQSYQERANFILSLYLTDFTAGEINDCVQKAYSDTAFCEDGVAPLSKLSPDIYMLELWHGPTCAFKDMALQILPHLLTTSVEKTGQKNDIVILVATSGDTGKAALEGFKDVHGTQILVFYPEQGVSNIQKLQMATQEGENVYVCAIDGNFDDAQTAVKSIFTNDQINQKLRENNMTFSSANSINWGRLVPQIVYYFSAYCDLVASEEIALGDEVNVCVPTGNFGNILAGYYAKEMGLPIGKMICASNENNVLTDFFQTGTYNKQRPFHLTVSPSMDILVSSNLERLLFALLGQDDKKVAALMDSLVKTGSYTLDCAAAQKAKELFYAGCCNDTQTKETIHHIFDAYSYLCDTHTAVAVKVCLDYKKETGDERKTIVVSTASPYKFPESVLEALSGTGDLKEFAALEKLKDLSGLPIPNSLAQLGEKPVRFKDCCKKDTISTTVTNFLRV